MRHLFLFIVLLPLIGCGHQKADDGSEVVQDTSSVDTATSEDEKPSETRDSISFEGPIKGERVHGPANVRDTANGKVLFRLYHNVLVETTPLDEDWRRVAVTVKMSEKEAVRGTILPGKELVSTNGKVIGETKDTVSPFRGHEKMGSIYGYTYKGNIQPRSIPEKVLSGLIKDGVRHRDSLHSYMDEFEFEVEDESQKVISGLRHFFIYESSVVDPSPRDRVTLMFEKDSLIAVVHSRDLNVEGYNTFDLARGHRMTIIGDLDKARRDTLVKKRTERYGLID